MKNRVLMIGTAIASMVGLALPAIASGTGDQRGPRCLDIYEQVVIVNAEKNLLGQETGTWNVDLQVYLSNAPCVDATYPASFIIRTKDSSGDVVEHDLKFELGASDFAPLNDGSSKHVWDNEDYQIHPTDLLDPHTPYEVCDLVQSVTKTGRVADWSPDEGSEPCYDLINRPPPGARSYG